MEKAQHTPGPWEWKNFDDCQISIYGPETLIAVAYEYEDSNGAGFANARLISKAPELLALAKRCYEFVFHTPGGNGELLDEIGHVIFEAEKE